MEKILKELTKNMGDDVGKKLYLIQLMYAYREGDINDVIDDINSTVQDKKKQMLSDNNCSDYSATIGTCGLKIDVLSSFATLKDLEHNRQDLIVISNEIRKVADEIEKLGKEGIN